MCVTAVDPCKVGQPRYLRLQGCHGRGDWDGKIERPRSRIVILMRETYCNPSSAHAQHARLLRSWLLEYGWVECRLLHTAIMVCIASVGEGTGLPGWGLGPCRSARGARSLFAASSWGLLGRQVIMRNPLSSSLIGCEEELALYGDAIAGRGSVFLCLVLSTSGVVLRQCVSSLVASQIGWVSPGPLITMFVV